MKFKLIVILAIVILNSSCMNGEKVDNKVLSSRYIIKDSVADMYNNLYCTVYSPDTNWIGMAQFADDLVRGKGPSSTVIFYSDSSNIPVFTEYYGFNPTGVKSLAAYALSEKLYVDKNTLNTEHDIFFFKLYISEQNREIQIKSPYSITQKDLQPLREFLENHDTIVYQVKITSQNIYESLLNCDLDLLKEMAFQDSFNENYLKEICQKLESYKDGELVIDSEYSRYDYRIWYIQYLTINPTDTLTIEIEYNVLESVHKFKGLKYQ